MKCVICQKGMAQGVALYRINAKGPPGLWACGKHVSHTDAVVDLEVHAVIAALQPKAPDHG